MFEKETIYRDGLPIEKGIVLTQEWLDSNETLAESWLNFWLLYPDLFLDSIKRVDDIHFNLYFIFLLGETEKELRAR